MRVVLAAAFLTFATQSTFAKESATKSETLHKAAPEISVAELKKAIETKQAFVIDVNSDQSYKDGHIPTAIHFNGTKDKLASVLPKDKSAMVVAYCGGPLCTAWEEAATDVIKLGYTNVRHLKAGIKGWKEAKMTTEKGQG